MMVQHEKAKAVCPRCGEEFLVNWLFYSLYGGTFMLCSECGRKASLGTPLERVMTCREQSEAKGYY
jgi:predicted RNA-binding Zn-ribbon protein involved in translation (DUF1610 family)